jgi:uncharacterized membrane protein HdeD (DUF308 family)
MCTHKIMGKMCSIAPKFKTDELMLQRLNQFWWLLLLRGIISIAFGVAAFLNPKLAFEALVVMLGLFLFADGLLAMLLGLRMRHHDESWWVVLSEGVLGIVLGAVALLMPELTSNALVAILAIWFLVSGVFELSTAIRLRKEIDNEWLMGIAGVVSIALGGIMLINPSVGSFSLGSLVGIYALLFGVLLVGLGLRVRRAHPAA